MADEQRIDDMPTVRADNSNLKLVSRATYFKEAALKNLFLLCAFMAVAGVLLIFVFVGYRGWPIFGEVGTGAFLFGTEWLPTEGLFGILPLFVGSIVVTVGALLLGTPLAVGAAVFLSEIAPPRVRAIVRPAIELLAGVPSVVYGFFGLLILRPIVADLTGGLGFGPLTAWIILAIMIVPTIATLTEDALQSIPGGVREASYAMGATTWQTISRVLLPAAKIGIVDAVILGMGRAIGETMAVLMVVGNAPGFFRGMGAPMSTLTPGAGFLPEVCVEWENTARLAEAMGVRVVNLRIGVVLGPEGGMLAKVLPVFRMGGGGRLGSGTQWMSWIHIEDLVSLIVLALKHDGLRGPVNAAAPNPVRNSEFTDTLATAVRRPAIFPVPAFALQMLFGEMAEVMLGSQRVIPRVAENAGFRFEYPTLKQALDNLLT